MVNSSQSKEYADRLVRLQQSPWKRVLDVQAPYRWNLKRLDPGKVLDIGCGIGRNLINLSNGVGIDPNTRAIEVARSFGLTAYTPEDFESSPDYRQESYDSLLLAHVAEHIGLESTISLVERYLTLLKPNGKLIIITPQEAGYQSDATHIEFIDFDKLSVINKALGLSESRRYSFPFPRILGKLFRYNEFVFVSRKMA
jgi:2-polyprenyl-3-methyl-5-hydroxy-6-metoxy-1,4-benzoquinol methylase